MFELSPALVLSIFGKAIAGKLTDSYSNNIVGQLVNTIAGEIFDSLKAQDLSPGELHKLESFVEPVVNSACIKLEQVLNDEIRDLDAGDKSSIKFEAIRIILSARNIPQQLIDLNLDAKRLKNYFLSFISSEFEGDGNAKSFLELVLHSVSIDLISILTETKGFSAAIQAEDLRRHSKTHDALQALDKKQAQDAEKIQKDLQEIKSYLTRQVQGLEPQDAIEQVENLLKESGLQNPDFEFKVVLSSEGDRTIAFFPKRSLEFARLAFPNTEIGQQGFQKYKDFVEKGHACTFTEDEFALDWLLKLPDFVGQPMKFESLSLNPVAAYVPVAARLEIRSARHQVIHSVDCTDFLLKRVGTVEKEILIQGGLQPFPIFLVIEDEENLNISYETKPLEELNNARRAKDQVDFQIAMATGSYLKIIALQNENASFQTLPEDSLLPSLQADSIRLEELKRTSLYLHKLILLNDVLAQDFRFSFLGVDLKAIDEAYDAVTTGIHSRENSGTFSFTYESKYAEEILGNWAAFEQIDDDSPLIVPVPEYKVEYDNKSICLGFVSHTLFGVNLLTSPDDVALIVENPDSSEVKLKFSYESLRSEFHKWLPTSESQDYSCPTD